MRKIQKVVMGLFCFVFVCCATLGRIDVIAKDKPDYKIAISPSFEELGELKPGDIHEGDFLILNEGTEDFEYTISYTPYTVVSETYNPDFANGSSYTEIKDWISVDVGEGMVKSDGEQKVHYTVKVPSSAHGGAQAAAIMVTMKSDSDNASGVEAVRQLAYIVYANIDGKVDRAGKVLENKVPSFLFNPPIIGTSLVENTGNVYTRAEYKLQVFPLFSDEEVYTNEENPENNIVFPETKRYNEIKWEGAPQLGIFKVRQTVKIFDDESVTEKLVFLCPIWFLFVVILMVFLIIFWIVSRAVKRKREA